MSLSSAFGYTTCRGNNERKRKRKLRTTKDERQWGRGQVPSHERDRTVLRNSDGRDGTDPSMPMQGRANAGRQIQRENKSEGKICCDSLPQCGQQ
jgi:hypothetical protein